METKAKVEALFLGSVRHLEPEGTGEWWDREWQTGFYKEPMAEPCWLGYEGFRGDAQADRRHHGGPDKAVCVYAAEHYPFWRTGAGGLENLPPGAFGENLTTAGLLEDNACIGDVFRVGGALVQVSQPRQPCWKLARRWRIKDFALRVERTGFTGFYFRVLEHGLVRAGDGFSLESRPAGEWTVSRCNRLMHHGKDQHEEARELAGCRWLSASWKDALWARAERGMAADSSKRHNQP